MPFPKHHDDGKIHCFNTCPESEEIPNGQPYTSRKNCLPNFGFRILVCLKNREMKGSSKSTWGTNGASFLNPGSPLPSIALLVVTVVSHFIAYPEIC